MLVELLKSEGIRRDVRPGRLSKVLDNPVLLYRKAMEHHMDVQKTARHKGCLLQMVA